MWSRIFHIPVCATDKGNELWRRASLQSLIVHRVCRRTYIKKKKEKKRYNHVLDRTSYNLKSLFINRVYNSHHYGSVLWDLYGRQVEMACNTWSVSIRKMLRVDRRTHRYLIEPLSGMKHLKRMILGSFLAFTKKLATSPKYVVRNVFAMMQNDCRSVTGSNIRNIMLNCSEDKHRPFSNVGIEKVELYPCPADATWKIPLN